MKKEQFIIHTTRYTIKKLDDGKFNVLVERLAQKPDNFYFNSREEALDRILSDYKN